MMFDQLPLSYDDSGQVVHTDTHTHTCASVTERYNWYWTQSGDILRSWGDNRRGWPAWWKAAVA